jgi:molybdate transport system substrate-binding protein
MSTRTTTAIASALIGLGLALSGCSAPASTPTLTVFAAASMKSTFTALGQKFEAAHPGVKVTFNFAGAQTLSDQIIQGASADLFTSANEANMKPITDGALNASEVKIYASNQLEIAVPPSNPAKIHSFADLGGKDVKLVICAVAVPCGSATQKVVAATGVTLHPVSEEQAVTDVLAKVVAGEADAGLVYRTDVISAGDKVLGVSFPESAKAINRNTIVTLKKASQPALAQQFVDLVMSAEGQKVLADAGFGAAG